MCVDLRSRPAFGRPRITPKEFKPLVETMAKEVDRQRKRIGGNFVVVFAISRQVDRDLIRKVLPECTFVTLTLTREVLRKRLLARHDEKAEADTIKYFTNCYDLYEIPDKNESNTYNIDVTNEMTRDDVVSCVEKILQDI